jgi:hypothetical protein
LSQQVQLSFLYFGRDASRSVPLIAGTLCFGLLTPPLDGSETITNAPLCAKKVSVMVCRAHKVYDFVALLGLQAQAFWKALVGDFPRFDS